MALINCPECQKQVSSIAAACPNCAHPINQKQPTQKPTIQTIEQTSKRWKGLQLVGFILCGLGLVITFSGETGPGAINPGPIMFIVGLAIYILARFSAWWHHQ